MANKAGIKGVVESLCQILKGYGISQITPETLRQAKFDMKEATRPMWLLLSDLLHVTTDTKNVVSVQSDSDVVGFVKSSFRAIGYSSKEFNDLTMASSHGSRDLLIAFGWLLAKFNILSLLLDDLETPLFDLLVERKDTMIKSALKFDQLDNALNLAVFMRQKQKSQIKSIKQYLKYIAKNSSNTSSSQQLLKAVPFLSEATTLEFCLSHCSKKRFCLAMKELENEKLLLEAHIRWIEHEDIFWKWMSSVIHEKQTSGGKHYNHSDVTAEMTSCIDGLSLSDQLHSFSINSEAFVSFSCISKLIQKLSTRRLTQLSNEHVQKKASLVKDETHIQGTASVTGAIRKMQGGIDDIRARLADLREESMMLFDLDSDDIMKDVIHLPMPRR